MSILGRMKGIDSPVFWDMFHVTAGIISALAKSVLRSSNGGEEALPGGDVGPSRSMETPNQISLHRQPRSQGASKVEGKSQPAQGLFSPLAMDSQQRIHAKIVAEQEAKAQRESVFRARGDNSSMTAKPFSQTEQSSPPIIYPSVALPTSSAETSSDFKDWRNDDEKLFHIFARIFDDLFRVDFRAGNV